jgi:predicted AlkP superfamily phosphohydrolase/phosphomutase
VGRVVILGLDGATFRVLDPLMDQGHLPNLTRLRREGLCGELASTIPPVTPCAWSSFATGKNPGKHRIFDFIYREPATYRVAPVDARRRAGATLWHLADEAGLRACIFNVPLTYPPEPLRQGVLVTGLLTPPTRGVIYTHPPDLARELDRITGTYRVGIEQAYSPGLEARFRKNLLTGLERRAAAARYLWHQGPWDLFVAVFNETDTVQHGLWHAWDPAHPRHRQDLGRRFGDAFARVYSRLDREVGWYLDQLGPEDTLIVMSDHGAGPLRSFFFVNNWLLRTGLLRLRGDPLTRFRRAALDLGLTPNSIFNGLLRLGGGALKRLTTFGRGQRWLARLFLSFADVDWTRTRAYSFGNMGPLWVNLKGREPQGSVEPGADYEEVLKELRHELLHLRGPGDREPMVEHLWRGDELYTGPYVEEAPDLLFMPRDMQYVAFGDYAFAGARLFQASLGISASHRLAGVLLAHGPTLAPGTHPAGAGGAGAKLEDIAPTVLHLLGLPVPSDMDGRSLAVGTPTVTQVEAAKEGEAESAYSEEEKEAVRQHLRSLGYLA